MHLLELIRHVATVQSDVTRPLGQAPINDEVGRSQGEGHHITLPAFVAQVRPLKSRSYDIAGDAGREGAH